MGDSGGRFEQDPIFNNIPKNSTALLIWRVQNMGLTTVAASEYGNFYKGDAYVIYCACKPGTPGGMNDKTATVIGPLEINIHFWLGSEASTDEGAVAAIKSVELDMCLGGAPVQHRETEGHESKRLMGYFKDGIKVLKGGIGTGLRHVTDEVEPRLYLVKGKRNVTITELSTVSWSEMNDGDVYVLETKDSIIVWTGRYSNNIEKLRAAKFANTLKGRQGSSCNIAIVEDGQESSLQGPGRVMLDLLLPLTDKLVASHTDAPKDESVMKRMIMDLKLYKCSDESGTLKVTEVKTGPLLQLDLTSEDAFIVDNGAAGIWVWIGKKASPKERQEAMRNATGFVSKKGYSLNTRTTRVIDGGEPPEFQSLFKNWKVKGQVHDLKKQVSSSRIAQPVQRKFEGATLHEQPKLAASTQMVDDGSGQMEVWRVQSFDLVPVDERRHGEFFMGDCYVILYAYTVGNKEHYIVYHWQGVDSTQDEQATCAAKSVEMDQKLNGQATIVRIVQGKESPHFMAIFKGKMVVYEGGYASGFKSMEEKDEGRKAKYMLQVRGTSPINTKAVEVDFRAGSLNSNDCFLVVTVQETFMWCGKGANGDEREMAKTLIGARADPTVVMEGREPAPFWAAIGGQEPYADDDTLDSASYDGHPPRLFQCSNASGVFAADEMTNFSQEDLIEDDVMLLDTWDTIFLWLGVNCNRVERVNSQSLAFEYLKTDPSGRSTDTPIVLLKQGYEPPTFTGFFGFWDNDLWNNNMTYADICDRLKEENPGCTVLVTSTGGGGADDATYRKTYPMNILRIRDLDKLPDDIDPTRKEDYMVDGDFDREFGMSRELFSKLPGWKRQNLKKKAGVY